jgi:hypothetical protein
MPRSLSFKFDAMEEDHWPVLEQLEFSDNLLSDSRLDDEVVLDLTTANDRQALWSTELADCKPRLLICSLHNFSVGIVGIAWRIRKYLCGGKSICSTPTV